MEYKLLDVLTLCLDAGILEQLLEPNLLKLNLVRVSLLILGLTCSTVKNFLQQGRCELFPHSMENAPKEIALGELSFADAVGIEVPHQIFVMIELGQH